MMDFYYIFPMPNANDELFNWDYYTLREVWFYYIIILILIILVKKVWFYFFSLPKKNALRNFWLSCLCEFSVSSILGFILLEQYYLNLSGLTGFINFNQFLIILFFFILDYLIASFIITTLFILIGIFTSKLKIPTRIRAMRRYPFHFIK